MVTDAAVICFAFNGTVSAGCQAAVPRSGRAPARSERYNANGEYPGGYYLAMGPLASDNVDRSAMLMRFAALLAALAVLAAALAVAPGSIRQAGLLGLLVTAGPLGWFIVASNNPSGWAVAGVVAYWIGLLSAVLGSGRHAAGGLVVAAAGALLAASARFDAIVYLALISGAVIVAALVSPSISRRRKKVVVSAFAALAVLGLLVSSGLRRRLVSLLSLSEFDFASLSLGRAVAVFVDQPTVVLGSLGFWNLGWLDTPVPSLAYITALLIVGGVVFIGLQRVPRSTAIPWLVVAVALFMIPLWFYLSRNLVVGEWVQPRYLLPLLPIAVGWILVREHDGLNVRLSPAQAITILVGVWGIYGLSLHANFSRYISGTNVRALNLEFGAEWVPIGPLGPNALFALGVLACAGLLIALYPWVNPRPTR